MQRYGNYQLKTRKKELQGLQQKALLIRND